MAEYTVGKINVQLGVKSTAEQDLKGPLDALKNAVGGLGEAVTSFVQNPLGTMKNALGAVAGALGPVGVGVVTLGGAAVAAGGAIFSCAAGAAEMAERLQMLSARTGLSTTMIQGLKTAADTMGISGDALVSGLDRLNKQLALPGGGEFGKNMQLMGVALKDNEGKLRPVSDILADFNERLNNIKDPAERAQTAIGALGRGNEELAAAMLTTTGNFMEFANAMGEAHGYSEQQLQDMADLDSKLDVLKVAWGDVKQAVTVLAVEVVNFALSAVGHLGAVVEWAGKLVAYIPGMKGLGESIAGVGEGMRTWRERAEAQVKTQNELSNQSQKSLAQLKELKKAQDEKAEAIKKANEKYEKMVEELDKLAPKYKNITTDTEVLRDRMLALTQVDVQKMIVDLGDKIKATDDKLKAFSTTARGLVEDKSGLKDLNVDLSASKTNVDALGTSFGDANDKAKTFAGSMREEVSTVFTNLEQKLVDNLLKWNDWKSGLLSIAEDFAKAMLSKLVQGLFAPLEKKMSDVAGSIAKSLFGSGGGGGQTAGAAAGAAGGVGSIASSASSWITGGIAAAGGIIGGVISGAMVRQDTKEIEVNTRYTWLYCAEILRVAQEHTGMWWHFDDVWGDHFEWIHEFTKQTALHTDEVYYLLDGRLADIGNNIGSLGNVISQGNEDIVASIKGLASIFKDLKSYQGGGVVTQTGPAIVHRGEIVIPPGRATVPQTINLNVDGRTLAQVVVGHMRRNRHGVADAMRNVVRA